ncbi:MAG TPA: VCBS repeat-containing protein [Gemmatimonadales bacterium]|nr:VCBS repeat-containing protein [Gemmatimonadales bacterium]
MRFRETSIVAIAALVLGCSGVRKSQGAKLARAYCAACHTFPEPALLDKKTWQTGVLPAMAPRLGVSSGSLRGAIARDPLMPVLTQPIASNDWEKIVAYYLATAPDSLPYQTLPAEPRVDPPFFTVGPFVPHLQSTAIVTLLKADSVHQRILIGEAGTNLLRIFDWNRRLLSTTTLGSPPTDAIVEAKRILVLESGILDPNDEPKGSLQEFTALANGSLKPGRVLIDSLYRPVFVRRVDFDSGGRAEFLVCEFGNNIGRLALYRDNGVRYERHVLEASPGAIRFEIQDLTGDGKPDIVALFAQGDERITLFVNDGSGNFTERRVLARFPPVYGSMHFTLGDFNGDGKPDILYINGDNFDYSRVLKPYHGIHILENDGNNNFAERYFYPLYGAAQAIAADFDNDGDLDILAVSNFADIKRHPERGITYLENTGPKSYTFRPYVFTIAATDQWNVMAAADLNRDGRLDVLIGAMSLANIAAGQRQFSGQRPEFGKDPVLLFENRFPLKER